MNEQGFFVAPSKALRPAHRRPRPAPQNTTRQENEAKSRKKIAATIDEAAKEITKACKLPEAYQQRQGVVSTMLGYIVAADVERMEEINFITSIAESLGGIEQHAKNSNLQALRRDVRRMQPELQRIQSVIHGSYLLVMHEIERSYAQAWVSKNPESSRLYLELKARVGDATVEDKVTHLNALEAYLKTAGVPAKVKLGRKDVSAYLTEIEAQLEELSPQKVSAAP